MRTDFPPAALVFGLIGLIFSTGCAHHAASHAHANAGRQASDAPLDALNAVLWQQSSAEYYANTRQSFLLAEQALLAQLSQPNLSAALEQSRDFSALPPAVIVDVDETMLDNSAYMARRIVNGRAFLEADWAAWCQQMAATALPGAVQFSNFANSRGVRIIYLSNRDVSLVEPTRRNLQALGFSDTSNTSTFLFRDRSAGLDTKASRRQLVAKRFRIVLMIGDNLGDFTEAYKDSTSARLRLTQNYNAYWGTRWIMLANPSYGSWEQSVLEFDETLRPEQAREQKVRALQLSLPQ